MNSGRLSVPCIYDGSPLNGPDALPGGPARSRVGSPCPDAPLGDGFLLGALGDGFRLMTIAAEAPEEITVDGIPVTRLSVPADGPITERYLGDAPSAVYLIRPDLHVAARWPEFEIKAVEATLRRAIGKT